MSNFEGGSSAGTDSSAESNPEPDSSAESNPETDSSAEPASSVGVDGDSATSSGSDGESGLETELDPEDCPFPNCPRCGRPVTRVTSTGPAEHTASPCGCRVSGNLLD